MCCERAVSGMTSGFESAPPKWFGNSLHGTSATLRMNHSRFVAAIVCDIPMSLFVFSSIQRWIARHSSRNFPSRSIAVWPCPMSALGQKADICSAKSHVRFTPQKRTSTGAIGMSAKGQKRTLVGFTVYLEMEAAVRGRIILTSVNSPGCVSISIEPPCCLTMIS